MFFYRCLRYGIIFVECYLVFDVNDQCCQKLECNLIGVGVCCDVKFDCVFYGDYVCYEFYVGWVKDNCVKFCGFCGNIIVFSIYNFIYFYF